MMQAQKHSTHSNRKSYHNIVSIHLYSASIVSHRRQAEKIHFTIIVSFCYYTSITVLLLQDTDRI